MDYVYQTEPYAHQRRTVDETWSKKFWALFLDMGTGKTKVTLDTIARQYEAGVIKGALIVGNSGSYANWVNIEIPKHLPARLRAVRMLWRSGVTKKWMDGFEAFCRVPSLCIFVMNIEALRTEKGFSFANAFLSSRPCMMAVDESTTIKNPKAQQTKAAIRLGAIAKSRRILTGSPVTDKPLDVYSQADFLSAGCLGFRSYYAFRARYAEMVQVKTGQRSFTKIIGFQNLDDLRNRLKGISTIIKKEDCLDLPPKVFVRREIAMTPEQAQHYSNMKHLAITELETLGGKEVITAQHIITRILRLHQIACGVLPSESGVVRIPENRTREMLDIIEETRGKVIIWSNYRACLDLIVDTLTKEYGAESTVSYHGGTDDPDRAEAVRRIQEDADTRFFVGNPQTAGYGLTLTAATTVIYYSNNYNLAIRQQSEDRCHRIGQTKSVTYLDIVATGTVDEKILKALADKKQLADTLITSTWLDIFEP